MCPNICNVCVHHYPLSLSVQLSVSVYGALCHGQHVTQWSAGSKEVVTCHDCQQYCDDEEGLFTNEHNI